MALSRRFLSAALVALFGLTTSFALALDVTIDTFDSYLLGDIDTVGSPPWTAEVTGVGEVRDDGGDQYLSFGDNGGGDWRHLFRSTGVPLDSTGSLEFRIYIEAEAVDHAFGLTDSSDTIDFYSDYGPYVRVTDDTAGAAGVVSLDARDGGAFVDDIATLNLDQWYDIRLEIDTTGGDAAMGGSNVYVDEALVFSSSDFRRPFGLPLDSFLLMGGNGAGLDVRVDDIRLTGLPDLIAVLWDENGGGNWGDATNWQNDTLPQSGDEVAFAGVLTAENAPATITLDVPATINKATFSNANQYIVAGPNALTLTGLSEISTTVGAHEISAVISGSTGLNKTGAGDLLLTGNNNYSGTTNIQAGGLGLVAPGSIPGTVNVDAGATLFFAGDGTGGGYDGAFTNAVGGTGGVTLRGTLTSETVTFSNAKSYSGATTVAGGTLELTGSGTPGSSDGTAATHTLVTGNAATGKLALSGGISVANELLTLGAREGEALEAVHVTSDGNNTWGGNIKGDLGGTQYNIESTAGTLTLSGTISAPDTASRNIVFSGAGNTNVTGRIVDSVTDANGNPDALEPISNLANVNVVKRGSGTLTISTATDLNDDYWEGTTTIEEGTLEVRSDGSNNGELRSSVAVRAGATFDIDNFGTYNLLPIAPFEVGLSGAGTIQANTLGVFESSTITPGDDGIGTLTVNGNVNLTYFDADEAVVPNSGSLNFEIGDTAATVGGAENDLIDVNGSLAVSAPGGSQFQVNVTLAENSLDTGTYTLIDANSLSGTATNANFNAALFTSKGVAIGETRQTAAVNLNSGNGNVELAVTNSARSLTWVGNGTNSWSKGSGSPTNWNSGTADRFFDLDSVTFNAGGTNQNVDVATDVVPGAVTVTGSGADYTFTGSTIHAASVTVSNNAIAAFDNTVSGNVAVQNTGTLGGSGTLQDNVSVAAGGTLRVGSAGLANTITSGSVSLVEDFEGYTVASYNGGSDAFVANSGPWESNVGGTGLVSIEEESVGGNKYLAHGWSAGFRGANRAVTPIADGSTGTFYFQIRTEDETPDASYGLSDEPTGLLNAFGAFEVQVALTTNATEGIQLGARNGGTFETSLVTGLDANTWYDIWVVVDNDTDTYDVYYGTAGDPNGIGSAIKIADNFSFRNGQATNDLVSFLTLSNNHEDNNANVDNIYSGSLTAMGGPESMTIEGDLDLAAGSIISFDIGQSGLNDSLNIDGSFSVADGTILEVLLDGDVSAASLAAGDSWDLLDFDVEGVAGTWDANDFLLPAGLGSGLSWDTSALLTTGVLSIISDMDADFDGNGLVNGADFLIWQRNSGGAGTLATGDANNDGVVNAADLAIWRDQYGTAALEASVAAVPEPGSILLATMAGLAVTSLRRRK